MKNYKEIEFCCGQTIEHAVNELLEYKKQGILACGEFNGTKLYSDTVTMDNAYIAITGKTKAESDRAEQEWRDNYKREEEEHKSRIPSLSEEWIHKGHEVLSNDKWAYWDRIVPIRLADLYRGMELGYCLEIVKILNNGCTLDEAKKMIGDQNHSGMSYSLVCAMVEAFCDRGKEFSNYARY